MPASIWLQPTGTQQEMLRSLIAALAGRHGTASFEPHLTVCSARGLDPAKTEAAADYVRRSAPIPLAVRRAGISYSTTTPFRAVVIEVENALELSSFREALRRIIGAAEPEPPHISLLYTITEQGERPGWWSNGTRLRAIAEECAARIEATEFVLDHPIIVAPDGDWTNINSWKVVRKLQDTSG
jgi:2'-5' RNA ligase